MTPVTEDNLPTIQSIALNVDCEASKRLRDYILDFDMFFNNLPHFHSSCLCKLKYKLQSIRKKRKCEEVTDFSLCIFCQEHKCETLSHFADQGFASFLNDLNNLNDDMIENLNKFFNFERVKTLVDVESSKEEFSPNKFKTHKCCRQRFRVKMYRRKISHKTSSSEPENTEVNVETTTNEDIFELLAKRKKKNEELEQRKKRKMLPEPNEFNYETKCVLCGVKEGRNRGKFRSIKDINIQKTIDSANKREHSDIIKILNHGIDFKIGLLCHYKCFLNYNKYKPKKGVRDGYEMAFRAVITEIENPMFKDGKVFSLVKLREMFLTILMEYKIESTRNLNAFSNKIKEYYTFDNKCRVNIILYPDYFIYSNHLSESEVTPQINELKKEQFSKDLADSNKDTLFEVESNKDSENNEKKKKWRFLCTQCGYKCLKKGALKKHLKKHEVKNIEGIALPKPVMCDICGKMVKSQKSLKVHLLSHSGETYPCPQCEKIYKSKYALRHHALTHTGVKNVECPDCGKKYFAKKQLSNHISKVHRGKQFLCTTCGKSFKSNDLLKEHSNKHTGIRPFICKECGKGFKFRGNLRTHVLAHDGKKPQMCSICNFGCYTKDNLKIHMAQHTDNKEFMYSSTVKTNEKSISEKDIHIDDRISNIKYQTYFPL
ncbi:unnamed protein product [Meganyctiphanes norvegica]|uniref:C2H2-type domain-containing protein n=1 Tax=Meganyctiphanes norvegica TaxID=48144 RepID=A0AAV2RVQ7_MEGNR